VGRTRELTKVERGALLTLARRSQPGRSDSDSRGGSDDPDSAPADQEIE
jgi:23S rRNA pseudouridine2605 synthase